MNDPSFEPASDATAGFFISGKTLLCENGRPPSVKDLKRDDIEVLERTTSQLRIATIDQSQLKKNN